jgi:hypothetical protein
MVNFAYLQWCAEFHSFCPNSFEKLSGFQG